MGRGRRATRAAVLAGVVPLAGACGGGPDRVPPPEMTVGNPAHGLALLTSYGCTSCHRIPGADDAPNGQVGPPLAGIGSRSVIAGRVPNNPENLQTWVRDPRDVKPETLMPDVGVSAVDARDIVAYLYTLD